MSKLPETITALRVLAESQSAEAYVRQRISELDADVKVLKNKLNAARGRKNELDAAEEYYTARGELTGYRDALHSFLMERKRNS